MLCTLPKQIAFRMSKDPFDLDQFYLKSLTHMVFGTPNLIRQFLFVSTFWTKFLGANDMQHLF